MKKNFLTDQFFFENLDFIMVPKKNLKPFYHDIIRMSF